MWLQIMQHDLLYGAEPNDIGMRNDNDENMGGDDIDMQSQPSYHDFSSFFMTFICLFYEALCFVTE